MRRLKTLMFLYWKWVYYFCRTIYICKSVLNYVLTFVSLLNKCVLARYDDCVFDRE